MALNNEQKALLHRLLSDPVWVLILQEVFSIEENRWAGMAIEALNRDDMDNAKRYAAWSAGARTMLARIESHAKMEE